MTNVAESGMMGADNSSDKVDLKQNNQSGSQADTVSNMHTDETNHNDETCDGEALVVNGAQDQGDKFYITLTQEDQEKVLECLASGQFSNPSDFIRRSIGQSHHHLAMTREINKKFRTGMVSLCARLERYQKD